ncbi:c-type cytochrome [Pasteurellaceae bacterium 22721_9_1]
MKKLILLTALCAVISTTQAHTPDMKQGERTFRQMCSTCHGRQGERSALGQSAIINKLPADEIVTALQARKKGEIMGAGNSAKARLSDQDMQNIATYLESLAQK